MLTSCDWSSYVVTQSKRRLLREYLGPLELRIMEAVWALGDATVNDVLDRLNRSRGKDLVYNTVMSTMARLHDKGFLSRERDGRAYVYSGDGPDDFLRARATEVFSEAYENLGQLASSAFVEAVSHLPQGQRDDLVSRLKELNP